MGPKDSPTTIYLPAGLAPEIIVLAGESDGNLALVAGVLDAHLEVVGDLLGGRGSRLGQRGHCGCAAGTPRTAPTSRPATLTGRALSC